MVESTDQQANREVCLQLRLDYDLCSGNMHASLEPHAKSGQVRHLQKAVRVARVYPCVQEHGAATWRPVLTENLLQLNSLELYERVFLSLVVHVKQQQVQLSGLTQSSLFLFRVPGVQLQVLRLPVVFFLELGVEVGLDSSEVLLELAVGLRAQHFSRLGLFVQMLSLLLYF